MNRSLGVLLVCAGAAAAFAAGPAAPPERERPPLLSQRTVSDIWLVGEERVYALYLGGGEDRRRIGSQRAVRLPDEDEAIVFLYEAEALVPQDGGAPVSTRMRARYLCGPQAEPLRYEATIRIGSVEFGQERVEEKSVTCLFREGRVEVAVDAEGRRMTSRIQIKPYTYLVDFGVPAQVSLPVGLRDFDLYDSEMAIFFSPQGAGRYSARVRVEERRTVAAPEGGTVEGFLLSIDGQALPRQYAVVDRRGVVYRYEVPSEGTVAVLESIRFAGDAPCASGAS